MPYFICHERKTMQYEHKSATKWQATGRADWLIVNTPIVNIHVKAIDANIKGIKNIHTYTHPNTRNAANYKQTYKLQSYKHPIIKLYTEDQKQPTSPAVASAR